MGRGQAARNYESEAQYRPARLTKKWAPKSWRPEYQRVVGYSALGLSNTQVAEKTGFSAQHVSNILNLPEAQAMLQDITRKIKEQQEQNIPSVLNDIAIKSALRIKSMLNDDELYEKSPFAVIDRGMEMLKLTGHVRGGGNGAPPPPTTQNNTYISGLPEELMLRLISGIDKADEAKKLHSGKNLGDQ
jgi:polyhydroxyalkanoate synthesis regulator phasin